MTIAEQLNIMEFPFTIKDSRGNEIYWESSNKSWIKQELDSTGNITYYENSKGVIVNNRNKSIPELTREELTKMLGKTI